MKQCEICDGLDTLCPDCMAGYARELEARVELLTLANSNANKMIGDVSNELQLIIKRQAEEIMELTAEMKEIAIIGERAHE